MTLINDIIKNMDKNAFIDNRYRIMLLEGCGGFFDYVKEIKSISECEVVLQVGKNKIIVKGERLFLKSFHMGDLSLGGNILSIEMSSACKNN